MPLSLRNPNHMWSPLRCRWLSSHLWFSRRSACCIASIYSWGTITYIRIFLSHPHTLHPCPRHWASQSFPSLLSFEYCSHRDRQFTTVSVVIYFPSPSSVSNLSSEDFEYSYHHQIPLQSTTPKNEFAKYSASSQFNFL